MFMSTAYHVLVKKRQQKKHNWVYREDGNVRGQ